MPIGPPGGAFNPELQPPGTVLPDPTPPPAAPPPSPGAQTFTASYANQMRAQYPGIPDSVIQAAYDTFRAGGTDSDVQAVIRGSTWWAGAYQYFYQAVAAGLLEAPNEYGYTQYINAIRQAYLQYRRVAPTAEEIAGHIAAGHNAARVEDILSGGGRGPSEAQIAGLPTSVRGLFTAAELLDMSSGSSSGQALFAFAEFAQQLIWAYNSVGRPFTREDLWTRYQRDTNPGTHAAELGTTLAPVVFNPAARRETIDALPPAVRALFTPEELALALTNTPAGNAMWDLVQDAIAFQPATANSPGSFTRGNVQSWSDQGLTPGQVSSQLGTAPPPASAGGVFTPEELTQIANGTANASLSALYDFWVKNNDVSLTYLGSSFTRSSLQSAYDNPAQFSANINNAQIAQGEARQRAFAAEQRRIEEARRLAVAQAEVAGQQGDISYFLSTFGGGAVQGAVPGGAAAPAEPTGWAALGVPPAGGGAFNLGTTPPPEAGAETGDMAELAKYRAGQPSARGAFLQQELEKSIQKMRTVFSGTLARLERKGIGQLLEPPDVGR